MSSTDNLGTAAPMSLTQDWAGHTMDMAGALLLVIAAVFLVSLALRHLQARSSSGESHLKIIQTLSLGTKDRLLLVEVGADQILMAISAAGPVHLHTLTEPVEIAEQEPNQREPVPNFANIIKTIAGKNSQ